VPRGGRVIPGRKGAAGCTSARSVEGTGADQWQPGRKATGIPSPYTEPWHTVPAIPRMHPSPRLRVGGSYSYHLLLFAPTPHPTPPPNRRKPRAHTTPENTLPKFNVCLEAALQFLSPRPLANGVLLLIYVC
jgi:hypothetical protein